MQFQKRLFAATVPCVLFAAYAASAQQQLSPASPPAVAAAVAQPAAPPQVIAPAQPAPPPQAMAPAQPPTAAPVQPPNTTAAAAPAAVAQPPAAPAAAAPAPAAAAPATATPALPRDTSHPAKADERIGLRNFAAARNFRVGTSAPVGLLRGNADDGNYPADVAKEFNFLEPENELKPPSIWLGQGSYNWENADYLLGAPGQIGWAQEHGVAVRGHVLVYARDDGYTVPNWLRQQEKTTTPDAAKQLLYDYIHTVVGRYKGKIAMWDVVNESISDRPNGNPFNLRDTFWFRKLGIDFLKDAFQWAHEADPDAELYYNDYSIEEGGAKFANALHIVQWLRSQGCYVTGIGMQYHLQVTNKVTPESKFYATAKRLQDDGFAFMITELDVAVPAKQVARGDARFGQEPAKPEDLAKQAQVFRDVYRMALSFPNCHGVNIWGFTDLHSWIPGFSRGRNGVATPMDNTYTPKAAYWGLQEELGRALPDGLYQLMPQSGPDTALVASDPAPHGGGVMLLETAPREKRSHIAGRNRSVWRLTWQPGGGYRITPCDAPALALDAAVVKAGLDLAGARTRPWSGTAGQVWVVGAQKDGTYRISPSESPGSALSSIGTGQGTAITGWLAAPNQKWSMHQVAG